MSIGKTLARARRAAGLSIAEVSNQTRIRLSVIDGIERDDYSGCGGHARDDIRAIARAVGVDSGPLIEAFDAARRPAGWIAASEPSEPAVQAAWALPPGEESWPVTAGEDTEPITLGQPQEPVTVGDLPHPPVPATGAGASGAVRLAFDDRRPLIWVVLGGALLAGAALGGILIVEGASGQTPPHASTAAPHSNGSAPRSPGTRPPSPGHSARSPRSARRASLGSRQQVRVLVPARIAAFGPGGPGQGDSPELARQALAGKAAAPWHSAWYTTPRFGNLQSGTGLLLDMGRTVTITSARIALRNRSGADLALRIGNSPALASLPSAAHANGAGGVVQLKTTPTRGRYVLLWFTRLPQDQAGTFQVDVYDIKLRGYPR